MRYLIVALLLLFSIQSFSQNPPKLDVVVRGQVVDSTDNQSVPYATIKVFLKEKPQKMITAVATDADGNFKIQLRSAGDYVLSVYFMGKAPYVKNFSVKQENKIELGKLLLKDSENQLGEIEVSAIKPLVKVDFDKITYSMEDDPESKTNNVLDMLKKVPMVSVDGEDNIQVKGSSSFKIYINGKPSEMISKNPKDVLKGMPATSIKNIEVITEPGAKYDAEGVAGIINIITQKNTALGGYTVSLNTGIDNRGRYNLGGNGSFKKGKLGVTGNFNYNRYSNPESSAYTFTEDKTGATPTRYITSEGVSKNKGRFSYGSAEISYEIDTLNLLNFTISTWGGGGESTSMFRTVREDLNHTKLAEFDAHSKGDYDYGSTDFGLDYQRTFSVKDRLLTASYKLSSYPNNNWSDNQNVGLLNYTDNHNKQGSDGKMTEHTFQVDFTTPLAKIHSLETGLKYIRRLNNSDSKLETWDPTTDLWVLMPTWRDEFKHQQDIFSAYAGYSVKVKKIGFKTGLRFEKTNLDVLFPLDKDKNFDNGYSNFVPSATMTYQLKPMQSLRFGYNMRISRPGIWQLNPYENTSDATIIYKGNPNLEPSKTHSLNLNYSYFNPKLNMNANLTYSFVNNMVEQYMISEGGKTVSTYENIGKRREVYLSNYLNWSPTDKLRINANLGIGYVDLKSTKSDESSKGFAPRIYAGVEYKLPWTLRVNAGGGYFSGWRTLQGTSSDQHFHSISLTKTFLSDRLNIALRATNPFMKDFTYKNKQQSAEFYRESRNVYPNQRFGISVSFRFGEMKAQIQKARRGITNDDSMGGGGGDAGGGGEGGK